MLSNKYLLGFLFLAFTLMCIRLAAQDSTSVALKHSKALHLSYAQPDSAYWFGNRALKEAKQIENDFLIAKSYNIIGIYHDIQNQWDSSLFFYDLAIDKANESGSKSVLASALNNKGLIYWNRTDYEKAIEFYKQSLEIFEEIGSDKGAANTLNNIGLILRSQERWEEALQYQFRALDIRKQIEDEYGIGISFSNIGLILAEMNLYDSARVFLYQAKAMKQNSDDKHGFAIASTNIANTYEQEGVYDSAEVYFTQAVDIHRHLGNKRLLVANLSALGGVYYELKEFKKAEAKLLEAEKLVRIIDTKKELYGVLLRLGDVYRSLGEFERSSAYLREAFSEYHNTYEAERDKEITKIQERFETERRKKEIAEQAIEIQEGKARFERRGFYLSALIALLAFMLVIAVLIYRQQKFKHRLLIEEGLLKEELASQKLTNELNEERLRISRDLHDNIGSQLTFIISSIDNTLFRIKQGKGDVDKGLQKLQQFTQQTINELRDTIWAMNRDHIDENDLEERILHLRDMANQSTGKAIVSVAFEEGLQFRFNSKQGITLFRIIQEAVNNALKHANAESILLHFLPKDGVQISIKDNGDGFDLLEGNTGNGIRNMQRRTEELGGSFHVETEVNKGTCIRLHLKK